MQLEQNTAPNNQAELEFKKQQLKELQDQDKTSLYIGFNFTSNLNSSEKP